MRRSRLPALVAAIVLGVLATLAPSGSAVAAAGKPAPVKITLKPNVTGKVVSDKAACVKRRTVHLFGRASTGEVGYAGSTMTDDQGHYPGDLRRRGTLENLFTLVVGDEKCRIAQSPSIDAPQPTRLGQPAKRRISLTVGQSAITGRVTSKKAGCVKGAAVVVFGRSGPGGSWVPGPATTTNKKGKYDFLAGRRFGGVITQIAAVVIGDDHCSVAQSPTRALG